MYCLAFAASPFKSPRNLKTSDSTMSSFRVTWEPAPGEVKGYKVTFHPTGDERRLGELMVGPYDNTVVLEELRFADLLFGNDLGKPKPMSHCRESLPTLLFSVYTGFCLG